VAQGWEKNLTFLKHSSRMPKCAVQQHSVATWEYPPLAATTSFWAQGKFLPLSPWQIYGTAWRGESQRERADGGRENGILICDELIRGTIRISSLWCIAEEERAHDRLS
jgi:hypothetical protein